MTEKIELSRPEIQYLMELVKDHIGSGVYYGDIGEFNKLQDNVFEKLRVAILSLDPEMKGFLGI